MSFNETGLEIDDVITKLVVFRLDGLVVLFQRMEIPYLLLQLFDMAFLPLTKCALYPTVYVSIHIQQSVADRNARENKTKI